MKKVRIPSTSSAFHVRDSVRKSIVDSPLRHDLLHTLDYIERSGGVRLTKVRGTMGRKHVREIIEGFREKPGTWPPAGQSDEWRYPRLMMIDAILRCLNMVEEGGGSLRTTDLAKEFRSLSPEDQFLNMFSAWWNNANWEVLSERPIMQPKSRDNDYFRLIGFLREISEKDGSFHLGEIQEEWGEICGNVQLEETVGGKRHRMGLLHDSVLWLVIEPLVWFGIMREKPGGSVAGTKAGYSVSSLGSFMVGLFFSLTKQARMEAELAESGRTLDRFYRHSMYSPISPRNLSQEEEETGQEVDYFPQNYAS